MMTLTLKGINRKAIVSTEDDQLFTRYKNWLHNYQTFTYCQGNRYIFPKDSFVTACIIKARKSGLTAQEI